MVQTELLAPAGDPEKLETALAFGADAVYLGGEVFGLRAQAANFTLEQLGRARDLVARTGKRIYLTLNAYLHQSRLAEFVAYLEAVRELELDAYIVADPGVLELVRELDPQRPVHLSTQANTTNAAAVRFWQARGVSRINLARELTLEEIRAIRSATDAELETFVHGAMCVAYSGRCLLSASLAGRSANTGECTQSCRWRYALVEETRPGEYLPVVEDARGTYLLNSRDLCLVEDLPALVEAGVNSLKIEGRMKSLHYLATVVRVYRAALDLCLEDPQRFRVDPAWREELEKISHRPYDRGFLFGGSDARVHPVDARYRRRSDFVGVVGARRADGRWLVEVRNRFFSGETLELIGPQMRTSCLRVGTLLDGEGAVRDVAQPNQRLWLELPVGARSGDLLRRNKGPREA